MEHIDNNDNIANANLNNDAAPAANLNAAANLNNAAANLNNAAANLNAAEDLNNVAAPAAEDLNNVAAPAAEDLNIQQENAAAEQEDNNAPHIIEARWESQQAPDNCANCIHYGVWDDINVQLTVPCMNCAREHNWIWRNLPCYGALNGVAEATGNEIIQHAMQLYIVGRCMSLESVKPLLPLELQGLFHQAYVDYTSVG